MLNILLSFNFEVRKRALKQLSAETRSGIFNTIPTLTKILNLDKIKDYDKRVYLRWEYIQKHPNEVFWDYPDYIGKIGEPIYSIEKTLVSTKGETLTLTTNSRLYIKSVSDIIIGRYKNFQCNNRLLLTHRAVACTFLPVPERYREIPVTELEVNHIDLNRYHNHLGNVEWTTVRENIRHSNGHEDYLIDERFMFTVVIDNGFLGRKFILEGKDLHRLGIKGAHARNLTKGYQGGVYYGMSVKLCSNSDGAELGFPDDINELFHKDKRYFTNNIVPIIVTVLSETGNDKKFLLFGKAEIMKYFSLCTVKRYLNTGIIFKGKYLFNTSSIKDAVPFHKNMEGIKIPEKANVNALIS